MDLEEFGAMRGSELWNLPDPTPEEMELFGQGLYFCDHCSAPLKLTQERYCSQGCRHAAYGEVLRHRLSAIKNK